MNRQCLVYSPEVGDLTANSHHGQQHRLQKQPECKAANLSNNHDAENLFSSGGPCRRFRPCARRASAIRRTLVQASRILAASPDEPLRAVIVRARQVDQASLKVATVCTRSSAWLLSPLAAEAICSTIAAFCCVFWSIWVTASPT